MKTTFDLADIMSILPHRYPFLFLDKIIDLNVDELVVVAQKNVSIGEPFFEGHFPNFPLMPGVLLVEACAQAASFLEGYLFTVSGMALPGTIVLMKVDDVRFRRKVLPGDILHISARRLSQRHGLFKHECGITVEGELAMQASLSSGCSEGLFKLGSV